MRVGDKRESTHGVGGGVIPDGNHVVSLVDSDGSIRPNPTFVFSLRSARPSACKRGALASIS